MRMDSSPESQRLMQYRKTCEMTLHRVAVPRLLWWGPAYSTKDDKHYQEAAPEVLGDGIYAVIKTDNVLDADQWGAWRVRISDGAVSIREEISSKEKCAHSSPPETAWELLKSLCYDPTGEHPEANTAVYRFPEDARG